MKRRAFTLLELMIASAIFVVVMVLTTGIFSIASSYNGKLREMRTLSLTGKSVMEQLSTDVRLANGSVAELRDNTTHIVFTTIGEITLFICQNDLSDNCWNGLNTQVSNTRNTNRVHETNNALDEWMEQGLATKLNNSLVILQKNKLKVIFYRFAFKQDQGVNWVLTRYEKTYSVWPDSIVLNDIEINGIKTFDNRDANPKYDIFLSFQGYGPKKDSTRLMQPYVEAALRARTLNYDTLPVNARASFDLKTSIETRDYN